jgi:hypothetical protein
MAGRTVQRPVNVSKQLPRISGMSHSDSHDSSLLPWLFAATLLASATLLFLVQPMVAKMILPLLGGSPAVWNTCMVVFQALLLLGYSYAHLISSWLSPRWQLGVHAVVLFLPLLVLPIALPADWTPPTADSPIPWLLALLGGTVGLPFAVVATSAPLMQKWYAHTGHPGARDPYFLYAASNLGSMAALLGYPLLVEPHFRLMEQSQWWAIGYGLLLGLTLLCAWQVWRRQGTAQPHLPAVNQTLSAAVNPGWSERLHWVALALVPSSLMLGVTNYLSTDIAAIPLLWVIPLGLYLLSFILAFGRLPQVVFKVAMFLMPLAILTLVFMGISGIRPSILPMLSLHLLAFFVIALVCHVELAQCRPDPAYLTQFYLLMSLGGVLGGLLNALIAPLLFKTVAEYQLMLCAAYLLWPVNRLAESTALGRRVQRLAPWMLAVTALVATSVLAYMLGGFSLVRTGRTAMNLVLQLDHNGLKLEHLSAAAGVSGVWFVYGLGAILALAAAAYVFRRRQGLLRRSVDVLLPGLLVVGSTALILIWRTDYWKILEWEVSAQVKEGVAKGVAFGLPALLCLALWRRPARFALGLGALLLSSMVYKALYSDVLLRDRSFFGSLSVEQAGPWRKLYHGTTLHGQQSVLPNERREALTYYHRTGPIGQVFESYVTPERKPAVAIVGLGTGTLATYAQPGQKFDFYEIDPAVLAIAWNPLLFTYLHDADARGVNLDVVLGDARLQLVHASERAYGLIVIDAFSSDSIPMHLITREALQLYLSKLDHGGVIAFHISNRYLDLQPVLTALAADANLFALAQGDEEDDQIGKAGSQWVLLARRPRDYKPMAVHHEDKWTPLPRESDRRVWTDDFSNLVSVWRW